jgi:GH24 family phage-related lysozyme (muramidase)
LDGWQPPDWTPESSGLGFLFHPQTIAQMDLGDGQVAQATPIAAVNNISALPGGVDWGFIGEREGVRTDGYVPPDEHHQPDTNSGVTIASGFDLGGRTVDDLQRLGLTDDLVTRLTPFLGLRGQAAQDYLTAHPLNITPQQQQAIDAPAFTSYYNRVADNYNAAQTTGTRFQDLPRNAQTAITSLAYQYGTNLASATPHFWNQVTAGRWQEAFDNLQNFGDAHRSRRQAEGALMLDAINSGNLLPPQTRR